MKEKYLTEEKKAKFLEWLFKKVKYNKILLTETEKNILISLNRIKKIERIGIKKRVYKFISDKIYINRKNNHCRSFYLSFEGRDNMRILSELEIIQYKNK